MNVTLPYFTIYSILALLPLSAQTTHVEQSADPSKDHHFFVGLDLLIKHEEAYYPIEKITNQQAQIKVDGEAMTQDIRDIRDLRYSRQTKISKHFAQIDGLTCEPGYSVDRDPQVNAARTMIALGTMAGDAQSMADSAMRQNEDMRLLSERIDQAIGDSPFAPDIPAAGDSGMTNYQIYSRGMQLTQHMQEIQRRNPEESPSWDLLNVRFSLKADRYYPSGCLVFIFQLKEDPDGEPTMSWFHFLPVKDISPDGKSFDYQIHSYPDGMYIDSRDVSFLANGTEIPTNFSPKHVELSEADARTVVKFQYMAKYAGKTRPPQRVWKYLDPGIGNHLSPEQEDETILVKVDKEGSVTDISMSPVASGALTPLGVQEISSGMYLPGLKDGEPVPGELSLRLGSIVF